MKTNKQKNSKGYTGSRRRSQDGWSKGEENYGALSNTIFRGKIQGSALVVGGRAFFSFFFFQLMR